MGRPARPWRNSNQRVIVVGNSPSVLSHEYGKIIDSYDVVIRLNRCPTQHYEKFIGTKIDVWSTAKTNRAYPGFVPYNYKDLRGVWLRTPVLWSSRLGKINKRCIKLPNDFPDISHHIMYKTKNYKRNFRGLMRSFFLDRGPRTPEPCTGLLTILTAIKFFDNVTLHGFTFYTEQQDNSVKGYYRQAEVDKDGNHPEDHEWVDNKKSGFASQEEGEKKIKLVKALINHGKVEGLSPEQSSLIAEMTKGKSINILNPKELIGEYTLSG